MWERGYGAMSPRAVQERAGAGQGSMYHHFDGKSALAQAALDRTAAGLRTQATEILDGPGSALDRLVGYLRRPRDAMRGCPVGRHAQDPAVLADDALLETVESTFAWLRGRLTALVTEAFGDRVDAPALAATIMATVQGGYVLARAAGGPGPFADATDGLAALLITLGDPSCT